MEEVLLHPSLEILAEQLVGRGTELVTPEVDLSGVRDPGVQDGRVAFLEGAQAKPLSAEGWDDRRRCQDPITPVLSRMKAAVAPGLVRLDEAARFEYDFLG